jgi:hypothetical protein
MEDRTFTEVDLRLMLGVALAPAENQCPQQTQVAAKLDPTT